MALMAKPNAHSAPLPPIVDERIMIRGTSYLRSLDAKAIKAMKPGNFVVIQNGAHAERIAVVLRYEDFMALQNTAMVGGK